MSTSEISFAPASRKQKFTKSQEFVFAQACASSVWKIDRAQAPTVVAQGFRARMNNFHSILIVALNTAHMSVFTSISLDILSTMRTSRQLSLTMRVNRLLNTKVIGLLNGKNKRNIWFAVYKQHPATMGKSLGKPWQFSEVGLDHSLQNNVSG